MAKILVVDDDAAVQGTVRLLLERAGHSVVTAGDGRKGLSLCETGDFDLLFLDIFMPGMDGFETMRMVRQRHPLIPIIVTFSILFRTKARGRTARFSKTE